MDQPFIFVAMFSNLAQQVNLNVDGFYTLLIIALLFFLIFYFLRNVRVFKKNAHTWSDYNIKTADFMFTKLLGAFILAAIPLCLALYWGHRLNEFRGQQNPNFSPIILASALSLLFISLNLFVSRQPEAQLKHPQLKVKVWNCKTIFTVCLGWGLYLLGYEFFFRGFLFFPMIMHWGIIPAFCVNILIYALSHVYQGKYEALGSIFFGFLFCMVSFLTGSFWVAFITHYVFSISGTFLAVYFSKDLQFDLKMN